MTEDQARARIDEVFAKYVQPYLPGSELDYVDLLNEKPMDLEAGVRGYAVVVSIIEKSEPLPRISTEAIQPETLAVGDFYTLIAMYHEEIGFEKARAICNAVKEDGIFFRHMDDNQEMTPSEFLGALQQWEEDGEE